uniref:Vesicle transport through interaction with t-SNAREs 1A n=1 Tax=Cyprinus carpio carpio TaxID=630221 RepID=A0A9J8DK62_CYPCA
MSSDFETYELDFGTLTADITNKIGRIPKLAGEEKTQLVLNVDKQLEEVRELLEQMDLEVREIPIQSRGMYSSRLKSYKQEMEKLEKDFLRETDANLGKSSRILTSMLRRIIQNRILVFILGAIILLTIILAMYFNLRGH